MRPASKSFSKSLRHLSLALLACLPLAAAAAGCAVHAPAQTQVLVPLQDGWRDLVIGHLGVLAGGRAPDPARVEFLDDPQPCVLTKQSADGKDVPVPGHCGALMVAPAPRSKEPPVSHVFIVTETGEVELLGGD